MPHASIHIKFTIVMKFTSTSTNQPLSHWFFLNWSIYKYIDDMCFFFQYNGHWTSICPLEIQNHLNLLKILIEWRRTNSWNLLFSYHKIRVICFPSLCIHAMMILDTEWFIAAEQPKKWIYILMSWSIMFENILLLWISCQFVSCSSASYSLHFAPKWNWKINIHQSLRYRHLQSKVLHSKYI